MHFSCAHYIISHDISSSATHGETTIPVKLDVTFHGDIDQLVNKPKGNFKAVKDMTDRKVAGMTNRAMLAEREGATDEDRILIAEENAKRMKRFSEIAKQNNTTIEAVQKRFAAKMRTKIPAGVWYQDNSGNWRQKQ